MTKKIFKPMITAVLMGILAVGLLIAYGCKCGCKKSAVSESPPPNSPEEIFEYQGGPPNDPGESKPCPWKITGLEVGRWMNGNLKASTWAHGSFPLTGWITERPIWYINGTKIGRSWPFFNLKRIPNSSGYLKKGQNTVTVKFFKAPYAGKYNTYTFNYDPNKIKPGQHVKF